MSVSKTPETQPNPESHVPGYGGFLPEWQHTIGTSMMRHSRGQYSPDRRPDSQPPDRRGASPSRFRLPTDKAIPSAAGASLAKSPVTGGAAAAGSTNHLPGYAGHVRSRPEAIGDTYGRMTQSQCHPQTQGMATSMQQTHNPAALGDQGIQYLSDHRARELLLLPPEANGTTKAPLLTPTEPPLPRPPSAGSLRPAVEPVTTSATAHSKAALGEWHRDTQASYARHPVRALRPGSSSGKAGSNNNNSSIADALTYPSSLPDRGGHVQEPQETPPQGIDPALLDTADPSFRPHLRQTHVPGYRGHVAGSRDVLGRSFPMAAKGRFQGPSLDTTLSQFLSPDALGEYHHNTDLNPTGIVRSNIPNEDQEPSQQDQYVDNGEPFTELTRNLKMGYAGHVPGWRDVIQEPFGRFVEPQGEFNPGEKISVQNLSHSLRAVQLDPDQNYTVTYTELNAEDAGRNDALYADETGEMATLDSTLPPQRLPPGKVAHLQYHSAHHYHPTAPPINIDTRAQQRRTGIPFQPQAPIPFSFQQTRRTLSAGSNRSLSPNHEPVLTQRSNHVPGYAGHVPEVRDCIAQTFGVATRSMYVENLTDPTHAVTHDTVTTTGAYYSKEALGEYLRGTNPVNTTAAQMQTRTMIDKDELQPGSKASATRHARPRSQFQAANTVQRRDSAETEPRVALPPPPSFPV